MYNSSAANPPVTCANTYGSKSFDGNLPAATIITETAGLKLPPENLPRTIIAIAKASPIGTGAPVTKITYKKKNVPKILLEIYHYIFIKE